MYIRLEYSETTGQFHFSPLNDHEENKHGYITLSSKINSHLAEQFCEQIGQKFPEKTSSLNKISFARVNTEFLDFINKELALIRESMGSTYLQRSRIYRKQ